MIDRKTMASTLLVIASAVFVAAAQAPSHPRTENAALRYWMAFGLMNDPPADPETRKVLESVAASSGPWDEKRLGSIIDQNQGAILTMQRASRLGGCDWGLEYELGPATPLAHLAKGRVLARLNVLDGMRMASRNENARAVEVWLLGIRFSQHLAQGSSLIGVLTGKAALLAHLQALSKPIERGGLSPALMAEVEAAVRELPEYGFDWSAAVRFEAEAGRMALEQLMKSANPKEMYKEWFGVPAPPSFSVPSEADRREFRNLMTRASAAVRDSDRTSSQEMMRIQEQIARLNPVIRQFVPSLRHINEARIQVQAERANLLGLVAKRKRRQ